MSLSDYRLSRIEEAARRRRLDRIANELSAIPYVEPSREDLQRLQRELGIPTNVMAELFPGFEQ